MHLDFVALREPVTCELPWDPPGHKRLVKQFRRLELEQWEKASALLVAGDVKGAMSLFLQLAAWALDSPEVQVNQLAEQDFWRLLGAAQGKIGIVEQALGNAPSDGDSSSPMEAPSLAIPASTTTTPAPPSPSASRGRSRKRPPPSKDGLGMR